MSETRRHYNPFPHSRSRLCPVRPVDPGEEVWPRLGRDIDGWMRPVQIQQDCLFNSLDDAADWFARARVSTDEVDRWHANGWLSYDSSIKSLTNPQFHELTFIMHLVRSCLTEAQIKAVLRHLPKPYSYDCSVTAYSPQSGWVATFPEYTEEDALQFTLNHFPALLRHLVESGDGVTLSLLGFQVSLAEESLKDERK